LLVQRRDPDAAGLFRQAVESGDEELRALGAKGLYELGEPDALPALIAAINDAPDRLHIEMTPAVHALSEMGLAAIPSILPLLESGEERTRQRAQKALELITRKLLAGAMPQRPLSQEAGAAWSALWRENGSYDWNAPEPARRASIDRWRSWIEEQSPR
jgi:hypothetical protein